MEAVYISTDDPDYTEVIKQGTPELLTGETEWHYSAYATVTKDSTSLYTTYTVPAGKELHLLVTGASVDALVDPCCRYELYVLGGSYLFTSSLYPFSGISFGTGAYFVATAGQLIRRLFYNPDAANDHVFRYYVSGVLIDV